MNDLPHLKLANTTEKAVLEISIESSMMERRSHHTARAKWLAEQRERDKHETLLQRDRKLSVMARKEGMCIFWQCENPAKKGRKMCPAHAKQYSQYDYNSKNKRGRR